MDIKEIKNKKELDILYNRKSFNYIYDTKLLNLLKKNFILKDSLYLIIKKNNEFIGFCSIDRDWWEKNYFFIREILVNPKFQKIGIGEKLMKKCIKHAQNKKAIGVITQTDFKNFSMQKLCKKLQFKIWKNLQWNEGITYKLIF